MSRQVPTSDAALLALLRIAGPLSIRRNGPRNGRYGDCGETAFGSATPPERHFSVRRFVMVVVARETSIGLPRRAWNERALPSPMQH